MTRRRLIVAACVAVVALGAAWWLAADGLSAAESELVGTWRLYPNGSQTRVTLALMADRSYRYIQFLPSSESPAEIGPIVGRWSFMGDTIYLDPEGNPLRRFIRGFPPICQRLGLSIYKPIPFLTESVTRDRIVIGTASGDREAWTRNRGD